jgi:signal transduction histidine kinase
MPSGARIYLAAVWGAAIAATLAALWFDRGITTDDWVSWLALSAAAAIAQLLVVRTDKNQSYHMTITFVVAAALILPAALVVPLVLIQHVPEWAKERYAWYIGAFNVSNYLLDALLALAVFDLLGGTSDGRWAAAALTAATVFVIVNHALLASVLKLGRGHSLRSSALFTPAALATDLAPAVLGVALTYFLLHVAWLVPAAVLPLFLVYRSMRIPALHRAEARQSALVGFGLRALEDEPNPGLWDAAVSVACDVLGAEYGYLIDASETPLLLAAEGWKPSPEEVAAECAGVSGHAMKSRQPVLVDDFTKHATFVAGPALEGVGVVSALVVPIRGGRSSSAALGVFTSDSRSFAPEDIQFLQALGNIIGGLLARGRAEQALQESEARREVLLGDMLRAEEEERLRIAAELHDDTIQVMTASLLTMDSLEHALADEQLTTALRRLRQTRRTLGEAVERTRTLTFELRPPLLEANGLGPALEELAEQSAREGGFNVYVSATVDRFPFVLEDLTYRIMREALSNVRKHARASNVHVRLREVGGRLEGSVRDDGTGFDVEGALDRNRMKLHLGLDAMIERVKLAGGDVRISSRVGSGSRLTFSFPLDQQRLETPLEIHPATSSRTG